MKKILIGYTRNPQSEQPRPIYVTPQQRKRTHMHILAGSGKGKSTLMELMGRQDIKGRHGGCILDWHGSLYQRVLSYCAQYDMGINDDGRSIILLNPSRPEYVTGFNPFMSEGGDVSVQVVNRIAATIRPWGITDTKQLPTLQRICRLVYTFAVEQRQPLANAMLLLEREEKSLREYAMRVLKDPYIKRRWHRLHTVSHRDWDSEVLSTENRLSLFLASKSVRRFMGLEFGNINLREVMDDGKFLLVNLGASKNLDRESARVFASLLLCEFFEVAMQRGNDFEELGEEAPTFPFYLDEFQEYITGDVAAMLDQVRKGGLHMILAHQHLGHIAKDEHLLNSLLANARIRVVLGGLPYSNATVLANEMFLPDLNTRQVNKQYYGITHIYDEQTRISYGKTRTSSHSEGRSRGGAITETEAFSTMETESKGTGRSYTLGKSSTRSDSESRSLSLGVGSSVSSAKSLGRAFHEGMSFPSNETFEGWESQGHAQNVAEVNGTSHFDFASQAEASGEMSSEAITESDSESESYSRSIGRGQMQSSSVTENCSESFSDSESISETETETTVFVPIAMKELRSESEWTREEKVSRAAELLINQPQRFGFAKLDEENTEALVIPYVKRYRQDGDSMCSYQRAVYEAQGAIRAEDADRAIALSERKFLSAAHCENVVFEDSQLIPRKPPIRSKAARTALFATIKKPTFPELS